MDNQFLIVHRSALPDYFQKVVEAKALLASGRIRDVSAAAKAAGISRSTYYKYKDYVFEPSQMSEGRRAVLSMVLTDEGDIGQLSAQLIGAGFSVSFSPLSPKEHIHVQ